MLAGYQNVVYHKHTLTHTRARARGAVAPCNCDANVLRIYSQIYAIHDKKPFERAPKSWKPLHMSQDAAVGLLTIRPPAPPSTF